MQGAEKKAKKVAVLGAGPAGLSCAYFLGQMGYGVTVFERLPEPGGMAAVGIPDYRLPRVILGGEERMVKDLGVEIRYNTIVGKDVTIPELRSEFDALFIGVGAHRSQPMGVSGEDKGYAGFIAGVKYLLDINMGKDPYPAGQEGSRGRRRERGHGLREIVLSHRKGGRQPGLQEDEGRDARGSCGDS